MEIHGNATTFNLESVLRQNILASDYYRHTCATLQYSDIVDEIYENVDHVEPWMSGNARGPSSAFCLMHRLCAIKLNAQQIKSMLDHRDSPFIRAVGFLYLRYVADPKTLWNWCSPYIKDPEMFSPSGPGQKEVSMGDYLRDLLLSQYYFETIFPRIPKPVEDVIKEELKGRGLPTSAKGNGGAGGADRRGADDTGNRRPASVKASLSVAFGQRAPNRAGVREEGRGRDPSAQTATGNAAGRARASASPEPPRDRREPPPPARREEPRRDDRRPESRDRDYDRGAGRGGYDRDRRDTRDTREYDRRDERRDPRDDRDRDRDRGGRGGYGDRDRDRGYDERDRRGGSRDRSRSRSRDRRDVRDARDVFKDGAATRDRRNEDDIRSRYGNGR
ncbi:hypothetical protein HYH03_002263 [Edaphochlamys debaryana]|uniref:Pre-mRNA-splicing factor 38 n=1 Tax=Edaphochlamys debaryana TaxID=47281 RepID=A0A835YDZ8_9CHLO|nr:hypothetical protein HYH03_002263 [Edaphochlamys debaryana]|eukprot:KAG2499979.1 hypothetical protein HYH03_002263 [Edaphochlamys debaryana]